jgi:hypothetical protein
MHLLEGQEGFFTGGEDPKGYNVAGNQTAKPNVCPAIAPCNRMAYGTTFKGRNSVDQSSGGGGDGFYWGSSGMIIGASGIRAGGARGSGYVKKLQSNWNMRLQNNVL